MPVRKVACMPSRSGSAARATRAKAGMKWLSTIASCNWARQRSMRAGTGWPEMSARRLGEGVAIFQPHQPGKAVVGHAGAGAEQVRLP